MVSLSFVMKRCELRSSSGNSVTTPNAFRYCRVSFQAFVGQPGLIKTALNYKVAVRKRDLRM